MIDIKVGNQEWSFENLKESKFRKGDKIPVVDNWVKHAINQLPSCTYVDNKVSNLKYGLIFNGVQIVI